MKNFLENLRAKPNTYKLRLTFVLTILIIIGLGYLFILSFNMKSLHSDNIFNLKEWKNKGNAKPLNNILGFSSSAVSTSQSTSSDSSYYYSPMNTFSSNSFFAKPSQNIVNNNQQVLSQINHASSATEVESLVKKYNQ